MLAFRCCTMRVLALSVARCARRLAGVEAPPATRPALAGVHCRHWYSTPALHWHPTGTSLAQALHRCSTGTPQAHRYSTPTGAPRPLPWHPTAVVGEGARIAPGVRLGPFCVVSGGATLGADCDIGAGAHVLGATTLGAGCVLRSHAVVGAEVSAARSLTPASV